MLIIFFSHTVLDEQGKSRLISFLAHYFIKLQHLRMEVYFAKVTHSVCCD